MVSKRIITQLLAIKRLRNGLSYFHQEVYTIDGPRRHDDGSLVSRPKAGLVLPEVATEFGMIEIYPQSGVYWYRGQKEAVLFNCQQPETVMSRIIDVFFDKNIQKLSSARGIGKFKPLCPVIIDACLNENNEKNHKKNAGDNTVEDADDNKMVEISPGTGICLPHKTFNKVLMKGRTMTDIGVRLLRIFFSSETLANAGRLSNLPKQTVEAIVACALGQKSLTPKDTNLPTTKYCQIIKKALHNAVAYERRDKEEMKRRAKAQKLQRTSTK